MDIIIQRFPIIVEGVFEQLDDNSIKKCIEVSKLWQKCIENKKFSWIRIVNIPEILTNENTYCQIWTVEDI